MKKEFFLGALCFLAGVVIAVFIAACMFKNLHWPGGDLLMAIVTPFLLGVLSICFSVYVARFGVLTGSNKPMAKYLHLVEIAAIIAVTVLFVALIFRVNHWPGGAQLVLVSCSSLSLLSLIAGFLGCKLLTDK